MRLHRVMPSLRLRLIGLFVVLALAVAAVMILAVERFSADQIMALAKQGGASPSEAQAMFDTYVARVLIVGALVGVALGAFAAWWLLRRILQPLDRLAEASRAIAEGDLGARVPDPPDPELRGLATAFNQMAATLERVEQLRTAVVEDVAHELRTPLTNLQGYLEALRDGVIEPTSEQFRSLQEEVERLVRLARSLEALAAGPPSADAAAADTVDVAQAVRSAVELVRPAFEAKAIRCEVQLPGRLAARAHADQLSQVLSNLLQNASRYTPEAGEVRVVAEPRRGEVLVSVVNTGAEIPPADLPRVFERFYRVEKSRDATRGGAGIGLAIVKQTVEACGGRVGAESGAGRTRFWFSLPA